MVFCCVIVFCQFAFFFLESKIYGELRHYWLCGFFLLLCVLFRTILSVCVFLLVCLFLRERLDVCMYDLSCRSIYLYVCVCLCVCCACFVYVFCLDVSIYVCVCAPIVCMRFFMWFYAPLFWSVYVWLSYRSSYLISYWFVCLYVCVCARISVYLWLYVPWAFDLLHLFSSSLWIQTLRKRTRRWCKIRTLKTSRFYTINRLGMPISHTPTLDDIMHMLSILTHAQVPQIIHIAHTISMPTPKTSRFYTINKRVCPYPTLNIMHMHILTHAQVPHICIRESMA